MRNCETHLLDQYTTVYQFSSNKSMSLIVKEAD